MAQLSNDCFAFGGKLQRLDAALDALAERIRPVVETETVPLASAFGRILAHDVAAAQTVPGFDNAAVDGYAVRQADLSATGETRLAVIGRIAAGATAVGALAPVAACRIFTGAPIPTGADTVFMQEDVRVEGDAVVLPPGLKRGANLRLAGEDFARGAPVLAAGERLRAQQIAALAATGLHRIEVRRPLRVAIFSTGDEVIDIRRHAEGAALGHGLQFDCNRPMLMSLLAARGIEAIDLGVLPDRREAIAAALAGAAGHCHAILTSGGVSTGEEDHVKAAVEQAGRLDFWRLAIKPGRPIAMGTIAGTPFLGMPGNPAAVFVTFTRFVGPVLDLLAGARANRPVPLPVISGFSYTKKAERREYVRVRLCQEGGSLVAQRFPKDGAALLSSLIESDGLIELEEDRLQVRPGELLPFLGFPALLV